MGQEIITGNVYDKYNTVNPLYRFLMQRFMENLMRYIAKAGNEEISILEVGCGEGHLAHQILDEFSNITYTGLDITPEIVEMARGANPEGEFLTGSAYDLADFYNHKYDIVVMSEVLEHLEYPEQALKELTKVNAKAFIFSVPKEPVWRFLNILRLQYLKDFGNTPGHLQHWNKKSFSKMLKKYFSVTEEKVVFPWLMAYCKHKRAES